jgi:FixJ family two-component response regulator
MSATLPPLVVVVENDHATLKALGRVLRAGGFEAATYGCVEDFLTSPPARPPKCLVVDVQLGALSALDLQRRLKEKGSTVPVIVMTAFDDPRVRAESRRLGCVACFDKGSDIDDVLAVVRSL